MASLKDRHARMLELVQRAIALPDLVNILPFYPGMFATHIAAWSHYRFVLRRINAVDHPAFWIQHDLADAFFWMTTRDPVGHTPTSWIVGIVMDGYAHILGELPAVSLDPYQDWTHAFCHTGRLHHHTWLARLVAQLIASNPKAGPWELNPAVEGRWRYQRWADYGTVAPVAVDTLHQATQALQPFRVWMPRRNHVFGVLEPICQFRVDLPTSTHERLQLLKTLNTPHL